MSKVKVVIFDIDGTLLDSVDFNVANNNQTLQHFGYDYRVDRKVVKAYLGCTAEDFYKGILDEETHAEWEKIRAYNRAHMQEAMKTYGRGFEGTYETLKALYEKGYKIVLYSNCSRLYLEAAVEVIGIEKFIDYAECVKDYGVEKPDLVAKLLKKYKGQKAVVVGDRIHDVEAARANGIPCIGAAYGFGKKEIEEADYQINSMKELIQTLQEVG